MYQQKTIGAIIGTVTVVFLLAATVLYLRRPSADEKARILELRAWDMLHAGDALQAVSTFEEVLALAPLSYRSEQGLAQGKLQLTPRTNQGLEPISPEVKRHFERSIELAPDPERQIVGIQHFYEHNNYYDLNVFDGNGATSDAIECAVWGTGTGTHVSFRFRLKETFHFYRVVVEPGCIIATTNYMEKQPVMVAEFKTYNLGKNRRTSIDDSWGTVCLAPALPSPEADDLLAAAIDWTRYVDIAGNIEWEHLQLISELCRVTYEKPTTERDISVLQQAVNIVMGQTKQEALEQYLDDHLQMCVRILTDGIAPLEGSDEQNDTYFESAVAAQMKEGVFEPMARDAVAFLELFTHDESFSNLLSSHLDEWKTPAK